MTYDESNNLLTHTTFTETLELFNNRKNFISFDKKFKIFPSGHFSYPGPTSKYDEIMVLNFTLPLEKIAKLERMTVENGASEAEEASAKASITRLQKKAEESNENKNKYIVTGVIPAHMEHPPKMNWHIEKDGLIIAKGNGVLKYADVSNYYTYTSYMEDMKKFKTMSKEEYIKDLALDNMHRWNDSEERATEAAESHYKIMIEDAALIEKFEQFINKIDTTCGGLLGEGDGTIYEKVTVTEYKTENKVVEDASGSIKEGQCFIVKTGFNYGHNKGYVYRIHETVYEDGKKLYHA